MRPLSTRQHSRDQWQDTAKQRGERERSQRPPHARLKAERDQATTALTATQARLRQLEAHRHGLATVPTVDVIHVARQRFCEARMGLRAVSRLLTLLACVAPPTVRTTGRLRPGHRFVTWAQRLLLLSPAGGAKAGAIFARLRACLDALPACTDLSQRWGADAQGVLECQKMRKTKGLSHDTLAQCQPRSAARPSAPWRLECAASLAYHLATAKTVGLDHVGVPISAEAIASLFGVAKRHGVGQTQGAARRVLRLPAFCGAPRREDAAQVLGISVARPHAITGQVTALTTQRREVLGHREALERLGRSPGGPAVARLPRPKNRSNHAAIVNLSTGCGNQYGPHLVRQETPCMIENVGPPDMREAALT